MTRTVWKLQQIGERLNSLALMTASEAENLGRDGRGMAIVAEEARAFINRISIIVERALFDGDELDEAKIIPAARQLNLLALNCAIEAYALDKKGKIAAVCAEEIRNLARAIADLFNKGGRYDGFTPMPKNRIKSVSTSKAFLLLDIAGVSVVESLSNIKEIFEMPHSGTHLSVRGTEIPLIDMYKTMGKTQEMPSYVVLNTPWAAQNKLYAVAAEVSCIFECSIGLASGVPDNLPFGEFVREYWESENDMPFLFMDWVELAT